MTAVDAPKPTLAQLQRWMAWIVSDPSRDQPLPPCLEVIRAPAPERLDVYAQGYGIRLTESLAADFPVLSRRLGPSEFAILVSDYLRAYPSRYTSIGEAGRDLPGFIATHPIHTSHPEAPELAQLEWAAHELFFAENGYPAAVPAIEDVSPERWPSARLVLNPVRHAMRIQRNSDELWRGLADSRSEELARPSTLLLYRHDYQVRARRMSLVERSLMDAFEAGDTLEAACATASAALEADPEAGSLDEVGAILQAWFLEGLVHDIQFGSIDGGNL